MDREEDGTPLLLHIRRVASSTPADARGLAWLHELLEWTSIAERELLDEGLTHDELRHSGCSSARRTRGRPSPTSGIYD